MKKNKLIICFWFLNAIANSVIAQSKSFVIFTFENTFNISQHKTTKYYWIIPEDSLTTTNLNHLFLDGISDTNINDCLGGKSSDPLVITPNTTITLSASYQKEINELKQVILSGRRRLQTIIKIWGSGQKQTIVVYGTAIKGEFCSSDLHPIGRERYGYEGKIYYPISSFSLNKLFWNQKTSSVLLKRDFSSFKFDVFPF